MKVLLVILAFTQFACATVREEIKMNTELPDFNKMWNYSNPTQTRDKFLEILSTHEEKADLSYVLQLKTQIARTYSLEAKFEDAHKVLDEVEARLNDETQLARVRYYLERGRTYNSSNIKDKAKDLFIKAYKLGKEIGADTYAVDGAHMVALAVSSLEDKLEWNKKGLDEARVSNDESVRKWVGVFHNNMGWDLFEAKRYGEALEEFRQCWDFYEEIKAIDRKNIARWSYAKTLRFLGKNDESLKIQLALLEEGGGKDESGYGYEELGELYLLKGEMEKAKEYFSKAYSILSKDTWLQRNEKERLERIKKLADG